jgi:hypothetical protein
MRYRDDTFEISELLADEEERKTEWMNNNIYRNIQFEGKSSTNKIEFLDTEISIIKDKEQNYQLVSDIYSKKTDTHQYLSPTSCHPPENKENIPYSVIHRIRRNCSDNVENDENFKKQAIMYKAYLMKSGHKPSDIDDHFVKILKYERKDLLIEKSSQKKKKGKLRNKKIRIITDYEPKFPSISKALKELEPMIMRDPLLKKALPAGTKNIQICFRRKGKNIKEHLATAKINSTEREVEIGEQSTCGKGCQYCPLIHETSGNIFTSAATKRTYKLKQRVNCECKWCVYLVTCKRCVEQGVGSTKVLKSRISNYKSTILNRRQGKCGIDHHFLQEDHTWDDFQIQVIAKMTKEPNNKRQEKEAYTRLRQFEGYWQTQLVTMEPFGMNEIDELHRNRYSQEKPAFSYNY